MKRKFLTLVVIGLSLFIVACNAMETTENNVAEDLLNVAQVSFDFPHYNSIEHLSSFSTEVVRVAVLDERVEWLNTWIPPQNELEDAGGEPSDLYFIYTIYRVEILEVFKGDVEVGDMIEVKQIGGQMDDTKFINMDEVPLVIGSDLILFLHSFDDFPASLMNATQSAYYFPNARGRLLNAELESVHPENNLTLTLEALIQIAEEDE